MNHPTTSIPVKILLCLKQMLWGGALFLCVLSLWGCSSTPKTEVTASIAVTSTPLDRPERGEIKFETIQSGHLSGIARRTRIVIRSRPDWEQFWRLHTGNRRPLPTAPEVDFQKDMIVAVMMGQQSSGGYTIAIESITQENEKMRVDVQEQEPAEDAMTSSALSAPFHIVTVPVWDGEIEFQKLTKTQDLP